MQPGQEAIVAQLDELLSRIEPGIEESRSAGGAAFRSTDIETREMRTRAMAAIERLAPPDSQYRRQADEIEGWDGYVVAQLAGVLRALRSDMQAGYLRTVEELIHGELFDDFLELAGELSTKGFHAPAAVVAGAVLEEHLRKLALKNGIDSIGDKGRPKSVETLTVELVKAGVFTEGQRKIIAGWYGQRTEAAHGHFENVIADDVGRMIDGIRDFIVRHPA